MKKERVVGLCICFVLLGSFQISRFFGRPQPGAAASLPRTVWAVASGEYTLDLVYSRIGTNLRPDPVSEFVCNGWPPLGILYNEVKLMSQNFRHPPDEKEIAGHRPSRFETLKNWMRLRR